MDKFTYLGLFVGLLAVGAVFRLLVLAQFLILNLLWLGNIFSQFELANRVRSDRTYVTRIHFFVNRCLAHA